jgi:hypothetical protein
MSGGERQGKCIQLVATFIYVGMGRSYRTHSGLFHIATRVSKNLNMSSALVDFDLSNKSKIAGYSHSDYQFRELNYHL